MVSPKSCVVAGVGEYVECDPNVENCGDDPGPYDIGNVDAEEWTGPWYEPPDYPNGPPNFPNGPVPNISFPNFNVPVNNPPYISFIPVDEGDFGTTLGGNVFTPEVRFVIPTPDHDSEAGLSQQSLVVTGKLKDALESEGLGTITAYLKGMDDPLVSLRFEVELPNGSDAMAFYKQNTRLLDQVLVGAEYEIVYFVTPQGSTQSFLVNRFLGSFLVTATLTLPTIGTDATGAGPQEPVTGEERPEAGDFAEGEEPSYGGDVTPGGNGGSKDGPHTWMGGCPGSGDPVCEPDENGEYANYDECLAAVTEICGGLASAPSPPFTSSPGRLGYKNYQSIISVSLSPLQEAQKRLFTGYKDGILNPAYSFFTKFTPSPFLGVPYKLRSIFGDVVDSTIRNILQINGLEIPYSDYPYNSLNSSKIFDSLKDEVKKAITTAYLFNGVSLESTLTSAFRLAVIQGEIDAYTAGDIEEIKLKSQVSRPFSTYSTGAQDNYAGVELLLSEGVSLDPLAYTNVKLRNRLFNWKILAEDINKHVFYKTSDKVETTIYIPNSETLTVFTSDGTEHTLEMKDGDYFVADTLKGDKRLTVFSDRSKAIVYNPIEEAQIARLLKVDLASVFDADSVTDSFVEYNVDTTGTRQDYYFLKLDKSTLADEPDDNFLTQKTSATYDYITTGIDDYVKHNAFPGLVVYLNNDDMIFNHLESSNKVKFTHRDFTFLYFSKDPGQIIARRMPQHLLLIPTDRVINNITQRRSSLIDFNTRQITLSHSPIDTGRRGTTDHPYLKFEYDQEDVVNFAEDRVNNTIWQEKIKYVFDLAKVEAIDKYKNGAEVLPRKVRPAGKLLNELNNIKTVYELGERDYIQSYDLYSRLQPYDFRGLWLDVSPLFKLKEKLRLNTLTSNTAFNKNTFVRVKETVSVNEMSPTFLPPTTNAPQVWSKQLTPQGSPTVPQPKQTRGVPGGRGGGLAPY